MIAPGGGHRTIDGGSARCQDGPRSAGGTGWLVPATSTVVVMLTPPPALSDADIVSASRRGWGIRTDTIEYAPLGFGSHHWVATSADHRWFVTVDDLSAKARGPDEPLDGPQGRLRVALQAARRLRDHGLEFVVAPLAAAGGAITVAAAKGFEMAVYEHVAGIHHTWGPYPSRHERLAVLELVVRLHGAPEGLRADAGREDFEVPRRDQLVAAIGDVGSTWLEGPFAERARNLLAPHALAVSIALTRFDQMTDRVRSGSDRCRGATGPSFCGLWSAKMADQYPGFRFRAGGCRAQGVGSPLKRNAAI